MKIKDIIINQTKTGKDYKQVILEDERKLNVFQFHSLYESLVLGEELPAQLIKNGKYWELEDIKAEKKNNFKSNQLAQAQTRKAEFIQQAQERRDESIAFFNSVNAAISLLEARGSLNKMTDLEIQTAIRLWRNWFLEEFKNKPPF